jgi:hypothetical protein
MDNTFISFFLLFCLTLLLIMYLNQNMKCNKHKNQHLNQHLNQHNLVIHPSPNTQHNQNSHNNNSNSITNIFDTCKNIRTSGMPVHPVGPAINFHQRFTKYTTNPTYITAKGCGNPTGIPELGWRNMYLSNYSKNEIPEEDPFSGIPTRNYLDNMENVDNIYTKCF